MSVINFLEYKSYSYNRDKYPEFEPKDYRFLFKDWREYEHLYQKEKNGENIYENN